MDASTLKRLLLAKVKVHRLSNKQVPPAHLGFWGNILGVGTRSGGMLAKVRYNQKRVGVVEC